MRSNRDTTGISLILPTYNERDAVTGLIIRADAVLSRLTCRYEIIVVDDRSPDGTFHAVRRMVNTHKHIRAIVHSGPRDLGMSIAMGVRAASYDLIVGMDADGNHDPDSIPLLIRALDRSDLAVGSRFIHGGGMKDAFRYTGSLLFNTILRLWFGFPITDNTSGFYAISRRNLRALSLSHIYFGYGEYHLRLVYLAMRHGYRISEVPVWYRRREYGQSKSNLFTMMIIYLRTALALRRASA